MRIQKIILRFIGTGINNIYQACVNIYDVYGNLLYQKETYNGELILYLKENTLYKIDAFLKNDKIKTYFYTSKCKNNYTFIFNQSIFNPSERTITFLLTDANYYNLPIEKGKILLWQKQ